MSSWRRVHSAFGGITESLWITGVIGVVLGIAIGGVAPTTLHVQLTEPLWLLGGLRINMYEQHAIWGRWPTPSEHQTGGTPATDGAPISNYVKSLEPAGEGALNFVLALPDDGATNRLSMRIAQTEQPLSPVIVVCGYAVAALPYRVRGANATDIEESALPSPCRRRDVDGLRP